MKNKELIEEMVKIIHHTEFVDISGYEEEKIAEELLKYYQPKLPEDSVVLSKKEQEIRANELIETLKAVKNQASKETAEKVYKDLKLLVPDNALGIVARYFKEIIGVEIKES